MACSSGLGSTMNPYSTYTQNITGRYYEWLQKLQQYVYKTRQGSGEQQHFVSSAFVTRFNLRSQFGFLIINRSLWHEENRTQYEDYQSAGRSFRHLGEHQNQNDPKLERRLSNYIYVHGMLL